MLSALKKIETSTWFQNGILGMILLSAVVVGLETSREVMLAAGGLLHALDKIIVAVFVAEVLLKWGARWPRPWDYFRDGWNVFDFLIVVACLIPAGGSAIAVVRLFRVLRVLRLVRVIPRLRLIVVTLLHSLPSMFYVTLLLMMLFYVYAVAGVFLFRKNDPVHFGDLPTAMLSLFRVVTLEDWTDIMYVQMFGSDAIVSYERKVEEIFAGPHYHPKAMPVTGALYFVSFVLLGTMIMLNLVIGVVVNSMSEAQKIQAEEKMHNIFAADTRSRDDQIEMLKGQLQKIASELDKLKSS
jgi:voltage-gated sodium channel